MTRDDESHDHELGEELRTAAVQSAADLDEPIAYELEVIEGVDVGSRASVDGDTPSPLLVGTSQTCSLRLEDRLVSRRHLRLGLEGRRLRVSDLGSTNGTFVDGVRLIDGYLRGGEIVRIGQTALRVEAVAAQPVNPLPRVDRFGRLLGASACMRRMYPLCQRLASSDVSVVIEGETGTGKEVLAEALHELGPRAMKPFVVFDCTAVAPNLVESALFGHEKGAFTGAHATHRGVFEEAHGGTLLIDEIGDLTPALQPKLLRVLQRAEMRRVGGSRPIAVDVRVLAATRRDLDREVQAGRFRDDLFYRLAVARVELPPLRARHGDIALLARFFWSELRAGQAFPDEILPRLDDYAWPGNVRELANAIARLSALGTLSDHVAPTPRATSAAAPPGDVIEAVLAEGLPFPSARDKVLSLFEERYVSRLLELHDGNVAQAAAASGVARRYFQIIKARSMR
jgi:transcriptional regulator with GAF, ATPase, and Fis domain